MLYSTLSSGRGEVVAHTHRRCDSLSFPATLIVRSVRLGPRLFAFIVAPRLRCSSLHSPSLLRLLLFRPTLLALSRSRLARRECERVPLSDGITLAFTFTADSIDKYPERVKALEGKP